MARLMDDVSKGEEGEMARIKIDADELMMAMEDHGGYLSHYLDKEMGKILLTSEDLGLSDEDDDLAQRLAEEPDRYVAIESLSSRDGYRIMEDFVDSLPEGEERRILQQALSWRKPFSNFKSAIADMGPLREQWFKLHDRKMQQEMQDWLAYHELDAELLMRRETS